MEDNKDRPLISGKKFAAGLTVTGTIYALVTGLLTSEMVITGLSTVVHNQIAQAGFFYFAADWLRTVKMKKDMGALKVDVLDSIKSFSADMVTSIDKVAEALRKDLASKASIEEVQLRFDKVHGRIDALESYHKKS